MSETEKTNMEVGDALSMPKAPKQWEELTDSEKIEKLAMIVEGLYEAKEETNNRYWALKRLIETHQHNQTGEAVTPMRNQSETCCAEALRRGGILNRKSR